MAFTHLDPNSDEYRDLCGRPAVSESTFRIRCECDEPDCLHCNPANEDNT